MKLLTSLTSPFGRKIRVVLAEKHIECELVETHPFDADSDLPQINPLAPHSTTHASLLNIWITSHLLAD